MHGEGLLDALQTIGIAGGIAQVVGLAVVQALAIKDAQSQACPQVEQRHRGAGRPQWQAVVHQCGAHAGVGVQVDQRAAQARCLELTPPLGDGLGPGGHHQNGLLIAIGLGGESPKVKGQRLAGLLEGGLDIKLDPGLKGRLAEALRHRDHPGDGLFVGECGGGQSRVGGGASRGSGDGGGVVGVCTGLDGMAGDHGAVADPAQRNGLDGCGAAINADDGGAPGTLQSSPGHEPLGSRNPSASPAVIYSGLDGSVHARRFMSVIIRRSLQMLAGLASLGLLAAGGMIAAYILLAPGLPSVESVRNVELQVPLRVYTAEGELIEEFGEVRRTPVNLSDIPTTLIDAFIAAEDQRFYQHPGVDYEGIARAVWYLVRTGEKGPGGSTITMQLARNLFLSSEQTYLRKLREIFLALRIEQQLDKQKILELYLNKIYLGQRAYGVAAAAEAYYGRPLAELTLPEQAMIAGLPKAPSASNPLADPDEALSRRAYVLGRMLTTGVIDQERYESAMDQPITADRHRREPGVDAPYVAEMVRAQLVERFGRTPAYTEGYSVYTTVSAERQREARQALRSGLHAYDERHGYRGPLAQLDPALIDGPRAALLDRLSGFPRPGALRVGVVTALEDTGATLLTAADERLALPWAGMQWARPQLGRNAMGRNPDAPGDVLSVGDVVYARETDDGWRLAQLPEPQSGLVAMTPDTGRIRALVGGYDFSFSKFNRVTQAARQPGSAFKPLIYSAALANGLTPATLINDAPVVFADAALEDVWRPENYSGRVFGPTRLREALTYSRNLVSIRVLRRVGISPTLAHLQRFGLPRERLPRNLSLALGAAEVTPLELARAYAVFANGGYSIEPHVIERIVDNDGETVAEQSPAESDERPRAISADNAWLMRSMLRDVVEEGTARRASELGRSDIAGKTGTTNDQNDAWFSGFNGDLVTTVWVGFDERQSLGRYETGGRAALPIWMDFMGEALAGRPASEWSRPSDLVTVKIDPETGERVSGDVGDALYETFRTDHLPPPPAPSDDGSSGRTGGADDPLF